ncbi:MAG: hypothetical protein ACRDRL_31440, partial [Sciscionella sp.]
GYDSGGLARGAAMLFKPTAKPERVLSPRQTAAFERLVDALDGRGVAGPGAVRLVVDGIEFAAYVDARADDRVSAAGNLSGLRRRAGARS